MGVTKPVLAFWWVFSALLFMPQGLQGMLAWPLRVLGSTGTEFCSNIWLWDSISGHLHHVRPNFRKHGRECGMTSMLECLMVSCCYLSILPSTGPTILLSLCLCLLPNTLRTFLLICLSFSYTYWTTQLHASIHWCSHLSRHIQPIHKFIYSSIHIYPSSFPFFYLPTHQDIHPSIHPSCIQILLSIH